MTAEKLKFANMLKTKIDKLDREIDLIMDLTPPIRSVGWRREGSRGWICKIKGKSLIWKNPGLAEREIELSNEDGRALMDIRTAEREALQQILDELE